MVDFMAEIYCHTHHQTHNSLCSKCIGLKNYARNRLNNCRYQEKKPVCGKCGLKYYNTEFKDESERMYAYAGPRMFLEHPLLGLHHILDSFKK